MGAIRGQAIECSERVLRFLYMFCSFWHKGSEVQTSGFRFSEFGNAETSMHRQSHVIGCHAQAAYVESEL